MGCPAARLAPVYRPRQPRASPLWQLLDRHFDEFERVYDDRYQKRYGFWRPVIARTVDKFLACGDLHEGFARIRCPRCRHEFFVAFSCRRRCLCPSCHQKRALVIAHHIARDVCGAVAHRQFVFTIPKRLRIFFRYDRRLLGELPRLAWQTVLEVSRAVLDRRD
ncbi:MAG: transposase zinc-binding domain-containing protein, partial [Planctomycetota bacterium]